MPRWDTVSRPGRGTCDRLAPAPDRDRDLSGARARSCLLGLPGPERPLRPRRALSPLRHSRGSLLSLWRDRRLPAGATPPSPRSCSSSALAWACRCCGHSASCWPGSRRSIPTRRSTWPGSASCFGFLGLFPLLSVVQFQGEPPSAEAIGSVGIAEIVIQNVALVAPRLHHRRHPHLALSAGGDGAAGHRHARPAHGRHRPGGDAGSAVRRRRVRPARRSSSTPRWANRSTRSSTR